MLATLALSALLLRPLPVTASVALTRSLDIYTTVHTVNNGSCRESNPALIAPDGSYRARKAIAATAGIVAGTYALNRLARQLRSPWFTRATTSASYGLASLGAYQTLRTLRQCQW